MLVDLWRAIIVHSVTAKWPTVQVIQQWIESMAQSHSCEDLRRGAFFIVFRVIPGCIGRRMSLAIMLSDSAAWTFLWSMVLLYIMEEYPKNHFTFSQSWRLFKSHSYKNLLHGSCSGAMEQHLCSRGDSLSKQAKINISYCQEIIKFWEMNLCAIDSMDRYYLI